MYIYIYIYISTINKCCVRQGHTLHSSSDVSSVITALRLCCTGGGVIQSNILCLEKNLRVFILVTRKANKQQKAGQKMITFVLYY